MLSVLAAAFLLPPPPIDQPPRLRTILPNGCVTLIEPHFDAKSITIALVASARGAEDTPETSGWRHLLEHLLVKGRDGKLDAKLEAEGGFLRAETYRDATTIEIEVPNDKLDLGLQAVAELLHEPSLTDAAIAKEIPILRAELALTDDPSIFANAGWKATYGDAGLEPQGSADALSKAKASDLAELYLRQVQSGNVVLVISGPVNLDEGVKATTGLLSRLPGAPSKGKYRPRADKHPRVAAAPATGEAIAVGVSAYDTSEAVAVLAAALAWSADNDGAFVTYTPSIRAGLVTMGTTRGTLDGFRKVETSDEDGYFALGKMLARSWLQRYLATPRSSAFLRGLLLAQDPNASPERMAAAIDGMTLSQFRAGFEELEQGTLLEGRR